MQFFFTPKTYSLALGFCIDRESGLPYAAVTKALAGVLHSKTPKLKIIMDDDFKHVS
jgi:hypothetical protein